MSIGDKDAPQARPQGSPQRPPQGRGRGASGPAPAQGWGPRHGRGGFSNPDMNRHDSGHSDSNGYGQQYPSPRGPLQQRLPQMNLQDARGPPQKRFDPASPTQHRFGPNIQRSVTMPQNMGSVANAPGYEDQQQWNEPGPVAGYHASTTPNYVPARPSTASGVKGDVRQQQFEQRPPMPPVPYSQQQQVHQPTQPQDSRRGSLDNVYDDYYGDSTATNRHSRVSSIDMPDFDAIPDSGPKHRRGYSIEDHILGISKPPPTQMVAAVTVGPIDSAQAQRERFYQQSARTRSQPDLHGQYGQSNAVYEMAGDAPSVPPLSAAGIEGFSSNGLPDGPRGGAPLPRSMTMGNGPARASPSQGYRPGPGPQQNFDPRYAQQQPPVRRGYSDESAFSEPGFNTMRNGSPMVPGNMLPRPGTAAPAPGRVPNDPVQRSATTRPVNPDALPAHPAPVRAGLIQQNQNQSQPLQATRPPPVRHYNTDPTPAPNVVPQQPGLPPQRRDSAVHPVTHDELNRLRNAFKAKSSDSAVGLQLSKKLVEAASVLADENGTASAKAKNKNREKYILEAHKIVKKLVANGSAEAMFYLADCYGQGRLGLQVDTKEAFVLYQSAAKAGHPGGAYRTAVCCEMGHEEGGGTKKDPLKAVQWYRRAAALGDTPAMYKMGMILLKGLLGQQKNLGEAINMLKRAADNADVDNPHALHELALLYESQTGNERIIRDEAYSLSLFQQAADLGYKFSQFRLGQAYEYGMLGCPIDARTSIAWYTRAAAKEEHQSELALSGWYLTGSQGILEQSDTEAYLWARKAACAEPPLAKALFAMGYFTEVGIGCPRSLEEAKRWYGRAACELFSYLIFEWCVCVDRC
jgi:TPR repeat protein